MTASPALTLSAIDAHEALRVLSFRAGYNTSIVVAGTALLGIASGAIGVFAVLRRRALMSDAIAHATLPGVAGAFLVAIAIGASARNLPLLLVGAAVGGVLGVLVVQAIVRAGRLREDAAIGAVLSVFFGVGVVMLSHIQTLGVGGQAGISRLILGQTAAMSIADATTIGACALLALLACALLFKEFRAVCFDQDFAATQGWPITIIDLLMMALVVVVMVIGLQAVGLILVVAMLIIPAAAARFWTDRLWLMTVASCAVGGASGYLGATLSALLPRMPAGGVIVLVAGSLFLISMLAAPRRGVIAAAIRRARTRLEVAQQHALRALYEAIEHIGPDSGVPTRTLLAARSWSPLTLRATLATLRARGLLQVHDAGVHLTPRGAERARAVTRNHRLWEEYLVAHADVAPSHVHTTADMVEHVISPELLETLEDQLRRRGRLPASIDDLPPSLHPLSSSSDDASPSEDAS